MKRPFEKFISQNIFAAPAREWKPKLTRCSTSGGLFARFPPTISDFVREKSKGSSVCQARQRVLSSLRPRPRRLFVCPSNERAQVHLSFQFLSFHNATLWIYIVYSYLAHCIHSPARLLPDASIFRNGFENRVELATGSRIEKHQGEGYLGDAFSNIFALMEK